MSESPVDVLLLTSPRPPYLAPSAVEVSENSAPPLGLLYMARVLEAAGIHVVVRDLYRENKKPQDIVSILQEVRPKIVGISALTSLYHMALRVVRHVKMFDPSIVTVVGGPHATALPKDVAHEDFVNFVVRGEGEQTFLQLCSSLLAGKSAAKDVISIPGLAFIKDGEAVLTAERELLDFETVPLPARHLVPLDHYLQSGAMVTSRGCKYNCLFCSSVTFSTHKYRYRSAENVISEMDDLHRHYGIDMFEFLEDTFTAAPERIFRLCELLQKRDYRWGCQATIKDVSSYPDLLPVMVTAGCKSVFFGIESGNDGILAKVKGLRTTQVCDIINKAIDLGIKNIVTSFIIGHPWDTCETIKDTLSLMLRLREQGCHTPVSVLVPFPGSQIGNWPDRFGIAIETKDYSRYSYNQALISTRKLSRTELEDIYFDILLRLTE